MPGMMLVGFSLFVLATSIWIAKRDVVIAGFYLFFFLYTIFAMVGYQYFPLLSWALRLYFGPEVFFSYFWFVLLSFASFFGFFALFRRGFRPRRFRVIYRPSGMVKLFVLSGMGVYLIWMSAVFARDYDKISYAAMPQIPDFFFSIGFKQMIIPLLALYVFVRHFAGGAFERVLGLVLFLASMSLFLQIAVKAGNRTDILAMVLGVVTYETYLTFVRRTGGLTVRLTARHLRVLAVTSGVVTVSLALMFAIQFARTNEADELLPLYAKVLYNDYYTPAHMLFAAIGLQFVDPLRVLRSTLANAFFLGGTLQVPYLQQEIGDLVAPGSSSRSASFGLYIFAEGYMAMGVWGFLYNGLVPLLGILCWRVLSRSSDHRFNAVVAALTAMMFANITRSGTVLLIRNFYYFLIPGIVLFALLSGATLRRRGRLSSTVRRLEA